MGLMSLCDLIVVADHARFGLPEAKVGVFPMQVLVFLRGMISARHINELCLTGDLIGRPAPMRSGLPTTWCLSKNWIHESMRC